MIDLTNHWAGYLSLIVFVSAYVLVVFEEITHLRKSKPVMLAAGLIWALIGIAYAMAGQADAAHDHAARACAAGADRASTNDAGQSHEGCVSL